jgi:predicted metal-dependent enzyme (double-stranded beta helix superfamily)
VSSGDDWVLDTPSMRAFVTHVKQVMAGARSAEEACVRLRPGFAELLADPDWLPADYQADAPDSGMGGGIGQWLLYRAGDGSLSLFSLVVPAGSETPVHDHLAWGLVGLYRGEQEEEVYELDANGVARRAVTRRLKAGEFYDLIPPVADVHRVRTTSHTTSVSIHLLTNDVGCMVRHRYDPATGQASPFRSGYVNATCPDER